MLRWVGYLPVHEMRRISVEFAETLGAAAELGNPTATELATAWKATAEAYDGPELRAAPGR